MRKQTNSFFFVVLVLVFLFGLVVFFCKKKEEEEGFTPRLKSLYRPYLRTAHRHYEHFVSMYGPQAIMHKLTKWNIL